jgi:glutaminase
MKSTKEEIRDDYQAILEEIYEEIKPHFGEGKVANYIPALSEVDPNQFAFSIITSDGKRYDVGDSDVAFSIQSISKVFAFTLALDIYSKELYNRIGVEPSGNPFNSLIQLEYEHGKPRNPFINAGAIAVTDSLISHYKDDYKAFEVILNFVRDVSDDSTISFDPVVSTSEMEHAHRNLALANLMKSFNNLDNSPTTVVQTYFKQCAISMSSQKLARSMLYLANSGTDPITKKSYITLSQTRRINAVMLTCGHYDASGEFAFHVGLPGKSGVGGGVVAVVPNKMGICVWSPALNRYGNSHLGTLALEKFVEKTGLSIF